MEHYPIIKGQFNSYYDYQKIFAIQRANVDGKINKVVQEENIEEKYNNTNLNKKSKGPSLILRNTPRPTNRHK